MNPYDVIELYIDKEGIFFGFYFLLYTKLIMRFEVFSFLVIHFNVYGEINSYGYD